MSVFRRRRRHQPYRKNTTTIIIRQAQHEATAKLVRQLSLVCKYSFVLSVNVSITLLVATTSAFACSNMAWCLLFK